MKAKMFLIPAILLILSLACGGAPSTPTPTPDLQAILEVALQQTMAAQPTSTATAIPTQASTATEPPTATSTVTPGPTASPLPAEEAKAYSMSVREDGWQTYLYQDFGFAISLPPTWTHLDLSTDDFDALLNYASETNPELETILSSDYLRNLAASGIKLMAVDTSVDSLASGSATNLNVLMADLPFEIPFDNYVEITIQQLKTMLGEDIEVTREKIVVGEIEGEMLEYKAALNNAFGEAQNIAFRQYLLMKGKTQYVLTFTSIEERYLENAPLFEEIFDSFEIIE